jgi:hypothetical protein
LKILIGRENHSQRLWIWRNIPEDDFPWGEIIHEKSNIGTSTVVSGDQVDEANALVVVSLPDSRLADIQDRACLPTTLSAPLVKRNVQTAIQRMVPAGTLQFVQTRVICQDGETIEFRYVAIQTLVECINIGQSHGLNWLIPGKRIIGAKRLSFREGCLRQNDIARDTIYHPLVIVSERMKKLLNDTGVPAKAFCRIDDMEDIGFPA